MVVVETKPPEPFEARSELAVSDETARFVVVAWEVVALVAVNVVSVEEAVDTKPPLNSRIVEVAFSPVESFING